MHVHQLHHAQTYTNEHETCLRSSSIISRNFWLTSHRNGFISLEYIIQLDSQHTRFNYGNFVDARRAHGRVWAHTSAFYTHSPMLSKFYYLDGCWGYPQSVRTALGYKAIIWSVRKTRNYDVTSRDTQLFVIATHTRIRRTPHFAFACKQNTPYVWALHYSTRQIIVQLSGVGPHLNPCKVGIFIGLAMMTRIR